MVVQYYEEGRPSVRILNIQSLSSKRVSIRHARETDVLSWVRYGHWRYIRIPRKILTPIGM